MKRGVFVLFVLLVGNFLSVVSGNAPANQVASSVELLTIDVNDTVVFDLSNAILVNSTTIDIPVFIITDDVINALDFSFKFNESVITFDTLISYKSYLFALTNFNVIDRKLRFTSSSLTPIEHNTTLLVIRFQLSSACKRVTPADFNTMATYLNGGPCSYKITDFPNYTPTADFTNNAPCVGDSTSFNDISSITGGTITNWDWNLGNGTTSTAQHPVTTYTATGTYSVSLITMSNFGCPDTVNKQINVNVVPTANFSSISDCNTGSIIFTDNSTVSSGSIVGWTWDFGDADSSTVQHPTHMYSTGGNFVVTLTATSDSGCTSIYTDTVALNKPTAKYTPMNACVGSLISFSDSSTSSAGTINSWMWYFGDGSTSIQQHPTYTYTLAGTYTVSLKVTTNMGCADSVAHIIIIESNPIVKFGADNLLGCTPLSINFSDSTITSGGSTYYWDFGDTNISSLQHPSHTYLNSGFYTVKQVVTTSAGCKDSLVKTSYITIHDAPIANFPSSNSCAGATINFMDSSTISSGSITAWSWNWGDGNSSMQQHPVYSYSIVGTYTVTLRVTSGRGCSDSISKGIIIEDKPVVKFGASDISGCVPLTVYFTDSSATSPGSTYFWSFGDAGTATTGNATHTYLTNGNFPVKLIVTTPAGCSDSLIKINFITTTGPAANFKATPDTAILPNTTIAFLNLSNGVATTLWNFGDSTFTNQQNPLHTFPGAGTYKVCLTITDTVGCTDTYCDSVVILTPFLVVLPSAFTPNGDNANDMLFVRGGPLIEMELRIFNEWGNQIFVSTSQSEGWDGKYNSKDQPTGLYAYTLRGKAANNTIVDMHGVVSLVR